MTALSDALTAAQRSALAALEKAYVAGAIESEDRSRMTPELLGDANDLAAIICLDLDGLRFVVSELSQHNHRDSFVWELSEALLRAEAMLDAA